MSFSLPKLPYAYDSLEPYIDSQTMKIHYNKHHQAYTDKLNTSLDGNTEYRSKTIEALLSNLNAVPEPIRLAVRNNGGVYFNHCFFWEIMAPKAGGAPPAGSAIAEAIAKEFGSFEAFREKFSNAAVNHFGSGWAWLVLDKGKLEVLSLPNQDCPLSIGKKPLLCVDVWEHAYYLKYQNRRAEYVKEFFNVINWKKAEELYQRARQ
ncbi:Superoxide dismutase [Fe] [uncultured archaeon]|nr:Superoxide dismutase [Fe] [uncultured archaeon]